MRRFLNIKFARWLLLFAIVPLVSGNIGNAILCIEENGRVAIEYSRNGACGAGGISDYEKEHCPRCTDVSISNSTEINNRNLSTITKNIVSGANIINIEETPRSNRGNRRILPKTILFHPAILSSIVIRV